MRKSAGLVGSERSKLDGGELKGLARLAGRGRPVPFVGSLPLFRASSPSRWLSGGAERVWGRAGSLAGSRAQSRTAARQFVTVGGKLAGCLDARGNSLNSNSRRKFDGRALAAAAQTNAS